MVEGLFSPHKKIGARQVLYLLGGLYLQRFGI